MTSPAFPHRAPIFPSKNTKSVKSHTQYSHTLSSSLAVCRCARMCLSVCGSRMLKIHHFIPFSNKPVPQLWMIFDVGHMPQWDVKQQDEHTHTKIHIWSVSQRQVGDNTHYTDGQHQSFLILFEGLCFMVETT